jgi:hypothetical protein
VNQTSHALEAPELDSPVFLRVSSGWHLDMPERLRNRLNHLNFELKALIRTIFRGTMKTKVFALAAVCALFSGVTAFAQPWTAPVTTTATLNIPIQVTATSPLAFGNVTRGVETVIAATSASAGAVSFSGDESDQISITVPASTTIATTSGAGANMTVNIDRDALRLNNTSNTQGTATVLDASTGSALTSLSTDAAGDGNAGDGMGQAYLWIGGRVTPSATQQRGSYTGTFTVSVNYSN